MLWLVFLHTFYCADGAFIFNVGEDGNYKTTQYMTVEKSLTEFQYSGNVTFYINGTCTNPRLSIIQIDTILQSYHTSDIYINNKYTSSCNNTYPFVCSYKWMDCNTMTNYDISNDIIDNKIKIGVKTASTLCSYNDIYSIYSAITIACAIPYNKTNIAIVTPSPTIAPNFIVCNDSSNINYNNDDHDQAIVKLLIKWGLNYDWTGGSLSWDFVKVDDLDDDNDNGNDNDNDGSQVILMSNNDLPHFGYNQAQTIETCIDYSENGCYKFSLYDSSSIPQGLDCSGNCIQDPYFELYLLSRDGTSEEEAEEEEGKGVSIPITMRKQSFEDSQVTVSFCSDLFPNVNDIDIFGYDDYDYDYDGISVLNISLDYGSVIEIQNTTNGKIVYSNDIQDITFDIDYGNVDNETILYIKNGCYQIEFYSKETVTTS